MIEAVTRFLDAVQAGRPVPAGVFADDVQLDATVPNWRLSRSGADAVRDEFARWYADPGAFESVTRTEVPGGELVTFLLTWTEGGVPFAAHQAHVIEADGGVIAKDTVWCGGRWDAGLLAEMEEADRARA
ncbi:MAG TPA: hypothetical protein VME70_11920 [Mycobacteriales bacterium]|nr:hypothetical protein [Mycobacteriales bacterium]